MPHDLAHGGVEVLIALGYVALLLAPCVWASHVARDPEPDAECDD